MITGTAQFLDRIDQLGLLLFGEAESATRRLAERKYLDGVHKSFLAGCPLVGPRYALLKVTNRCNSGCIYCNHSIHSAVRLPQIDTSTEQMRNAVDAVAALGVRSINLTGGEPLLRNDLPEIIAYIYSRRLVSILLTNGLLMGERWAQLGKAKLSCIILTLDSLDPDVYERQRGASFAKAWNGFECSLRLRDEHPTTMIIVTVTVTRHNLLDLPLIAEKLSRYGVSIQFSPYHHYSSDEPDDDTPDDELQVRTIVDQLLSLQDAGIAIANSRAYLEHLPAFFGNPQGLPAWYRCYAAYVGVFIDAQLNVRPCWSWSLPIVGNLSTDDLATIWSSKYFGQQREKIQALDCSRCWLLCTAEPSIRFKEGGGKD